jgi:hypothetical protein
MVKYLCDVCGKEAVSSHKVERYQYALELCNDHLKDWVDLLLKELPLLRIAPDIDTHISRSLIDVVVAGNRDTMVMNVKPGEPGQPMKSQVELGIEGLHRLTNFFIETNKPI